MQRTIKIKSAAMTFFDFFVSIFDIFGGFFLPIQNFSLLLHDNEYYVMDTLWHMLK